MLGHKQHETRSWFTHYRGPLAIHAAARPPRSEEYSYIYSRLEELGIHLPSPKTLPLGAILGAVDLTGCQLMNQNWINHESEQEKLVGHWAPGRYAWRMENPVLLADPICLRQATPTSARASSSFGPLVRSQDRSGFLGMK